MKKRILIIISLSCLMLLNYGCSNKITMENENTKIIENDKSKSASKATKAKPIPIKYSKKETKYEKPKMLKKGSISKIVKEKDIGNGRVIIFEKNREYFNAAFERDKKIYDLGAVSENFLSDIILLSINETKIGEKELVRIDGVFGANCAQSNYFMIDGSSPVKFLTLDGNVTEMDLDKDGKTEIVTSSGTGAQTFIYKCTDENILVADVNKTLGNAIAVIYRNNYFEAYYKDKANVPMYFKYTKDGFIPEES